MKFLVQLKQTVIEEAWVEVDATDETAASIAALALYEDPECDIHWEFDEATGDVEVVKIRRSEA